MGNPVTKFQILSKNPEAHASFYASLFGWTIDAANALGYREAKTGSSRGIEGGFWPAPAEAPAFVQLFVEVEDVEAHVARATQLGASVIIPPQKLPDGDELAILLDPQGISVGLVAKREPGQERAAGT